MEQGKCLVVPADSAGHSGRGPKLLDWRCLSAACSVIAACSHTLYALQVSQAEGLILMVLEFGDIDLARLLHKRDKARKEAGSTGVDGHFIRLYWQQMLQVSNPMLQANAAHLLLVRL